jgi:D-sedoheptulose 7-phosphate isomerase
VYKLAEMFQGSQSLAEYMKRYTERLSALLASLDTEAVGQIIELFDRASRERNAIYFLANGGSAAVASHWVNDLVAGSYVDGQPPFRCFCLNDNVESVTAIGNDSGYDNAFVYQLRTCLDPGDVVYVMSVSGNSENIVRAVDYAKEVGATSVAICGFDGGRLKGRADVTLHIDSTKDEYGPVEDIFGILDHIVTGYLTMQRGKWLHH